VRPLLLLAAAVIALGSASTIGAQSNPAVPTNMAMRIAQARQANATLMQQYSWTSRTEVLSEGQVKDLRLETVNYAPGGQLQRTIMNDQHAPLPRGFVRRRVAEQERDKLEQYLVGLRNLLEQYTLPGPGPVQDFMSRSTATGPDASGLFQVTGRGVVMPGDTFTLWVNPQTRHAQKAQVTTAFQGDPVNLTATFKTLASGLSHVAFAELTVPAKQLGVQVQNFDYNRNN
jgi:hypothetical protein